MTTASAWEQLVKHAIMGTDHQQFSLPDAPSALQPVWQKLTEKSFTEQLLDSATLLQQYQRVGWQPPQHRAEQTVCGAETVPCCSPTLLSLLNTILRESGAKGHYLLAEWSRYAKQTQQRAPFEYLPLLLERGKQSRQVAACLPAIIGKRGYWLSQHNPAWRYLQHIEFSESEADEVWEIGTTGERLAWLRACRAHSPAGAREALQQVWKQEAAKERQLFLAVLWDGLSEDDAEFLQICLQDRSQTVRQYAIALSCALPHSDFAQSLLATLSQFIQVTAKQTKLVVTLPDEYDPAWRAQGIAEKWRRESLQSYRVGEKGGWLVQMLLNIRPHRWLAHLQLDVQTYLKLARKTDEKMFLVETLWQAVVQHRDRETALQLLALESKDFIERYTQLDRADATLLTEADKTRLLMDFIKQNKTRWARMAEALGLLSGHLSLEVSQYFLNEWLPTLARQEKHTYRYQDYLQKISLLLDPKAWETVSEVAEKALQTAAQDNDYFEQFLRTVAFRYRMQKEFQL